MIIGGILKQQRMVSLIMDHAKLLYDLAKTSNPYPQRPIKKEKSKFVISVLFSNHVLQCFWGSLEAKNGNQTKTYKRGTASPVRHTPFVPWWRFYIIAEALQASSLIIELPSTGDLFMFCPNQTKENLSYLSHNYQDWKC